MTKNKKIRIVQIVQPRLMKTGDYYRVESPGKVLSKLDDVKSEVNIIAPPQNHQK